MIGSQKIENTKILLMPELNSDKKPVMLTISSDLMKNYEAGSPVNIEKSFCVAQDNEGEPVIVSVGSDMRLYVITRDPGGETGWKQNDITPKKEDKQPGSVIAFEIFQMSSGPIVFACSVSSSSNTDETTMYVSSQLFKSDPIVHWDNFAQYWHIRPFEVSGSRMTKIYMGENPSSTTPSVLAVVAIEKEGKAEYYQLNTNLEESWIWERLKIPENAIKINSLALGKQRGYPGVYSLYDTVCGQSLQFTSFPIKQYNGKTFSLFFQPPVSNKINSFAVLPSGKDSDNVYAAGEGVYLFFKGSTKPITIAEKSEIPTVQTLLARQDDKAVTLWMVSGDGMLGMTTSPFSVQTMWQPILQICTDVSQIAALRNRYYKANQLLMINEENRLIYLMQDPESTEWSEFDIPLKDTENILCYDCYTTHMSIRDQEFGAPVTDIEFKLKSSTWTYLKVNGASYTLSGSERNQITIKPDLAGNITIINRVSSISTPVFELSAEWLKNVVDIDPATKVRNILSNVKSGENLRNIILPDGKKLIQDSVSKESVDSTANGIKQLIDLTNTLPQDSARRSVHGGTGDPKKLMTFTALLRDQSGKRRDLLSTSGIKSNYLWGMSFEGDNVTYYEGRDAREYIVERHLKLAAVRTDMLGSSPVHIRAFDIGDIGDAIETIAGDVLKALSSGLEKVGGFVVHIVEGVVEFIAEIGGKLLKFAIETVEAAMNLISWLFQKINVLFDDLVRWLGFVFDWNDIILTKKIIVNVINQTLELAKHKIGDAEAIVDKFFNDIEEAIDKIGPVKDEISSMNIISEEKRFSDKYSGAQDFLNSAPGNFANYHIIQSVKSSPQSEIYVGNNKDPLTAFFSNVVSPLGEDMANMVWPFMENIYGLLTANNLTIGEVLAKMSKDMFKQVINLARTAASGFLDIIENLLSLIKEILNYKVPIPALSTLYKSLSGGDDISLLDVVALLISIPATMLYKVLTGRSLYQEGYTGDLEKMSFEELFDTLSYGSKELTEVTTTTKSMETDSFVLANESKVNALKIYSYVGSASYFLADACSVALSQHESKSKADFFFLIKIALSAVKVGSTIPVDKKSRKDFYFFGWAGSGCMLLISNAIAVSEYAAPLKLLMSIFNLIIGGVDLTFKIIDGRKPIEYVLDGVALFETTIRSVSGILSAVATIIPVKTLPGIVLKLFAFGLSYRALQIRGGRTAYFLISNIVIT